MAETDVKKIIEGRAVTHGGYLRNAEITWGIMGQLMSGSRWADLHPAQKETLHMIAHKMHRIVNGDPMFLDHWVDIEGYTHLIVENLDKIAEYRGTRSHEATLGLSVVVSGAETLSELSEIARKLEEQMKSLGLGVSLGGAAAPAQAAMVLTPEPSELSPRPVEPAPATVVAAAPAEGSYDAPTACETCGGTGEIDQTLGGVGSMQRIVSCPDCSGEQTEASDHVNDRVFVPSHQRQPVNATNAEYTSVRNLDIRTGSLAGHKWSEVYSDSPGENDRWIMLNMYTEEYGN